MENNDSRHPEPTEKEIQGLASRYKLEFKTSDPNILDLELVDEHSDEMKRIKENIIKTALSGMHRDGLEFDPAFTKIFVVVESHSFSKEYGENWVRFKCKVMIFTNRGPYKFKYNICILRQNYYTYRIQDGPKS